MTEVYLGLGSNLGNRRENLRRGLRLLAEDSTIVAVSSLYETPPLVAPGIDAQPSFYNAVVKLETRIDPRALLRCAKEVEQSMGRRSGIRWGPRPIDVDLLVHGRARMASELLTVPHAGMAERAFVLVPLAEIDAALVPPGWERSVAEAAAQSDQVGMQCLEGPEWAGVGLPGQIGQSQA